MVKFKLLVQIPDFYLFWSIMTIIFHVSQFNKWSTISQSKPKQTPYCPCDPGLRKHTGTLYLRQASLIFPENMMTGRYNLFLYEGSWYHPITPLLFQKSWWILGFYRSLTVAVLFTVMMRLKHKTSWFRDGNLTDYVSLRESRFSQVESHHYHELCMC